jgi:type 1 fimbriae regulatory protein FimB/type 1 fimbriae regulatory protein FimE
MEPLNRDELLALLQAARECCTRDWCLLLLMYHHGMRASEVGKLRRADLNERDWTLNIERRKRSLKTLQVIYPNGVKLLDARKAISEWLQERPSGSAYLFPNPQDAPLSRISVFKLFKKHAATANLPAHKAAPHALKHSLGQHLHDSGQPIEIVAACLGHARIDSSRRYFDISFAEANHARRAAIAFQS